LTGVPTGTQTLYLTFTGTTFDVDDFTLVRGGGGTGTGPIAGLAGKCLDVDGGGTGDGTQTRSGPASATRRPPAVRSPGSG
jgi:hypothetical protein